MVNLNCECSILWPAPCNFHIFGKMFRLLLLLSLWWLIQPILYCDAYIHYSLHTSPVFLPMVTYFNTDGKVTSIRKGYPWSRQQSTEVKFIRSQVCQEDTFTHVETLTLPLSTEIHLGSVYKPLYNNGFTHMLQPRLRDSCTLIRLCVWILETYVYILLIAWLAVNSLHQENLEKDQLWTNRGPLR